MILKSPVINTTKKIIPNLDVYADDGDDGDDVNQVKANKIV